MAWVPKMTEVARACGVNSREPWDQARPPQLPRPRRAGSPQGALVPQRGGGTSASPAAVSPRKARRPRGATGALRKQTEVPITEKVSPPSPCAKRAALQLPSSPAPRRPSPASPAE